MSLKNLFGKTFKSYNSGTVDLESTKYADKQVVERQTYIPPIDFTTASNFAKYGLAEVYYTDAISRIYNYYPYDGSKAEVVEFHQSSSYLDRWMYEQKYPKTTGYATLGTTANYTANADGYGRTSVPEYILTWGGLHTGSSPLSNKLLRDSFDQPAKYKLDLNRTQNWRVNPVSGSTIEFWLKIPEFDTVNKTKSQVILDLWNGTADGSGTGRLTLELYKASSGTDSVFRLTMRDTVPAGPQQQVVSDSITDASLASWHHYALTIKNGTTGIDTILYIDGSESKKVTDLGGVGATLTELPGRLTGFIGAMQTPLPSGDGAINAAKLSGSLDEFRFWKTTRQGRQIGLNWFRQIGGGANTDDTTANNDLGVYYKFNEGLVSNNNIDNIVLDYSGRIANGQWIGYSSGQYQRHTGSALTLSSHDLVEELNPILRPTHSRITSLETIMAASGSAHDMEYGNSLYYSLPTFMTNEDATGDLKKLTQIFATYFDTLHAQITALPKIKDKSYVQSTDKAIPFAAELLKDKGFIVKDIFTNPEIVELISNADINAVRFSDNIEEIKNLIYTNIYNNLETIYKSKGTEKSIRNLIRCFGIDDEIIKLNVYTDGGTHYFTDKAKGTSVKKKYIKTDTGRTSFLGSIYQTPSTDQPLSFISGSFNPALISAENSAFTLEADVLIPHKKILGEEGFYSTPFLSCSVFGFHQANEWSPADYTWYPQIGIGREVANLQVYLVRDAENSRNAKFELRNIDETIRVSSDWINNIYDNNHWNLAIRIKPERYPYASSATIDYSEPRNYSVELYGVCHNFDEVENEISLKTTINNTSGSAYLNYAKRVFAGAEYTNFTGTIANKSDVEIGGVRGWLDYIDNATIKQHNLDPLNFGNPKSYRASDLFTVVNKHIPSEDLTIFSWDFDTVTAVDSSGEFTVDDITSGSVNTQYIDWIDQIIRREYKAVGKYFPVSSTTTIQNEYLYAQRKELPEISYTNDNIFIKGDKEINFITDDDVSDNFYALEVSMNQIVSEEMLKLFASVQEYGNLMSRPVDHYRMNYKRMDKVRQEFFSRVTTDLDQETFINYYKWIDQSISEMVEQLIPASVNYAPGVTDTIESHILERNKYQRRIGLLYDVTPTPEASARGVEELTYNYKFGHSPQWQQKASTAKITLANTSIGNFYNTVLRITDASGVLKRYILKNQATSDTGTTVSLNPGSGVVAHVIVGVQGLTYETAVAQLVIAINSANGHNGSISPEDKTGGVLNLTQSSVGTSGNVAVIGQSTYVDGSSIWSVYGIGSTSGFAGGVDSPENVNCLWQKERKEREDIANRERIRQVLVNETNISSSTLATATKTMYQGSTYARRRLSKPYKFGVDFGNIIHGGTNYRKQKDREFFKSAINVRGKKGSSGEPLNVFAIGLGKGNDIVGPKDCKDKYSPTAKRYYDAIITAGKFSEGEAAHTLGDWTGYEYRLSNGKYWPSNFVSESVKSGYNKKVDEHFKTNSVVTNLHSDTTYIGNDIPIQGPFTNTHVGGNQNRHVEVNRHDPFLRNPGTTNTPNQIQTEYTRPEAWRLLIGDNPSSVTPDGAIGYVGADYGGPYPDATRKWAIYSREEKAKRPVNIRNIQTKKHGWSKDKAPDGREVTIQTGSHWLGNYVNKYEVLHSVGYREQRLSMRDLPVSGIGLFGAIYKTLPQTTQPSSLFGVGTLLNLHGGVKLSYDAGVSALATNAKYDGARFIFHNPWGFGLHKDHIITVNQGSSTTNKDQIGLNSITTDADVRTKIRAAIDAAITAAAILGTRSAIGTTDLIEFESPGEAIIRFDPPLAALGTFNDSPVGSGHRYGQIPALTNDLALTKEQKTVIRTRFSAPGGIDTMSPAFLDISSQEYSVYNSLNYRNLTVRASGSGENGTIRVNSNIGRRNGLRTLLARHCGKGGLDSEYDSLSYHDSGSKDPQAAFFKQHRNTLRRPEPDQTVRRMALHIPLTSENNVGFKKDNFLFWPSNPGPLTFTFWFKGDATLGSNIRVIFSGAYKSTWSNGFQINIGFQSSSKQIYYSINDGTNTSQWQWDVTATYSDWTFYTITWDGMGFLKNNGPSFHYNNILLALNTFSKTGTGFTQYRENISVINHITIGDSPEVDNKYELRGSLANFAIWKRKLRSAERKSLYELDGDPLRTSIAPALIDYWKLGSESQFGNLIPGLKLNAGKTIPSSVGRNELTTNVGVSGSLGPYDSFIKIKDKEFYNNMFVTSMLPSSDFQYGWINGTLSCSVGDWLSDQKIRGYAPPSGKITIVGGSSIYQSVNAISFPTISDITCCDDGTMTGLVEVPKQPDGVATFNVSDGATVVVLPGVTATAGKIIEATFVQLNAKVAWEGGCCDESTLKYKITWWSQGDVEPAGVWYDTQVWPIGGTDISYAADSEAYLKVMIKDCDSNTVSITITLTDAKT